MKQEEVVETSTVESTSASPSASDSTSATEPATSATEPPASDTTTSATNVPPTDAASTAPWPPLPPVNPDNVQYVEFKRECTENGDCEFTLVAPHDSQKELATEQDEINKDKENIEDISKKIDEFGKAIEHSTTDAENKVKELSKKLEDVRSLLDTYQQQLKEIEKNVEDAEYQLSFAQKYIEMLELNKQMCYSKCVTEAPTSTPSTTDPPPTSTTPSPCDDFICNNGGKCASDSEGKPYCECPGNLDGHQHCDTGTCSDEAIAIRSEKEKMAPFVSPGFNLTSKSTTPQSKGITCIWKLESPSGYTADELDFAGLNTTTSKLKFYYGEDEIEYVLHFTGIATVDLIKRDVLERASNDMNKKRLNSLLSKPPIRIEFEAEKGSESHFSWTIKEKEAPVPE
ncbi:hypothetical protein Y032_0206g1959 [Ancylostoma ceylanicum]|uniref:EGF-like domain-containing protein n=1 Tax=Ancylostoma ceylanicum TaxID=53326 RepID=A0A016SL45_9BILA|nr:hypothetical protein Y032_0206g1959 [Ancylostoma ceylanicum]